MTKPINKAEEYANRKVPNPDRNDAPYFTSQDRWQDVYEAYEAGENGREPYIKDLESQSIGYFDNWEIANEEVERLKKENEELKETVRQLNAGMIHFSTLDKMPTLGLLDREGVITHVVNIGKNKVV